MWLLSSILLVAWLTLVPAGSAQERPTVIEVGLLIDGSGGEPIKDAVIVIEGKRIKATGKKNIILSGLWTEVCITQRDCEGRECMPSQRFGCTLFPAYPGAACRRPCGPL